MSRFVILCLVVVFAVSEGYAASRVRRQIIPKEFHNINMDNYLKNERAVRFQLKCILEEGPCDKIGRLMKETIPKLLESQCESCEQSERDRAGKLLSHIQDNFPTEWGRAIKKFQAETGGLVKPDDAARLESLLGVKLDPKYIGEPEAAK
ncbi:unnamed protein product [Orchesella dallaii]|uniref:Chemosensory protein n=1 Tax=Orchesella dallaii TaxID=48710 RepID=A0ABP1RQJ7_9HEXA